MKTQSKLVSGIFLVIVFVVLPGISYFYLQTGIEYHRARWAELGDLGNVQNMEFIDQSGERFSTKEMKGKMSVLGFFSPNCGDSCDVMIERFQLLQEQFGHYDKLLLLAHDTKLDSISILKNAAKEAKTQEGMWYWLTAKDSTYNSYINSYDVDFKDGYASQFALVDSNLTILRYYDVLDENEVNRLVIHLAKFAPRPIKEGVRFKREKEK
jgi:cytochrome oxidase Cu insertion factor (SCO1/SenC/PrrC family)